jgi:hypothetical protein
VEGAVTRRAAAGSGPWRTSSPMPYESGSAASSRRSACASSGQCSRSPRAARQLSAWRTSSPMPYESSSAASDVSLAAFGLRIIPAMQPSAARGKTAECVALCKRARRHLRRPAGANAIVGATADRDDRRDSDVADPIVRSETVEMTKALASGCELSARCREVGVATEILLTKAEQVSRRLGVRHGITPGATVR